MQCVACGREVPDGRFCTVCGTDQRRPSAGSARRRRVERFAAHPQEPVFYPGLLTSLLPHLDHDRVDEFRWAFLAGIGVLLLLYVAGLITAALLVAAVLAPVLYTLYLYEIRTYRDAPVRVFGFTIGLGVAVGAVVTVAGNMIRPAIPPVSPTPFGVDVNLVGLAVVGFLIPVTQEIIKPLPALLLKRVPQFGQTIDGLVFGVAAGLGFAMAQTIVQFGEVLTTFDVRVESGTWILPLLTAGILLPVLHGSSAGIIAASLWQGGARVGTRQVVAVGAALLAQVAFVVGSQLISGGGFGQFVVLAWQVAVTGSLLVYLRYVLHLALVDEAEAFDMRWIECPNCGANSTASGFCPTCGMALAASTDDVGPQAGRPSASGAVQ